MKHICVFASGNGSNFEALARGFYQGAKVSLLICDKADAYVIKRASKLGIKTLVFNPKSFMNKDAYEQELVKVLDEHQISLVCLAGYMRYVGSVLLKAYENRIINIHPSYLPAFKGKEAIKDAYEAKVSHTGVTVHYVSLDIDGGQIIEQVKVPIGHMSLLELETEIHKVEHQLFVKVVKKILEV